MNTRTVPALLVISLLVNLAGQVPAVRADDRAKSLYQRTLRATAYVECRGVGAGTGWVVDRAKGLLVTNHHVVEDQTSVFVLFPIYKDGRLMVEQSAYKNERGLRGKVLDTDVPRDLAIIQVIDRLPDEVTELKLAADSASPAETVHSIGNPGASDAFWVYTSGTVRQVYEKEWGYLDFKRRGTVQRKARVMETQSPVNHGDSGGPVVNDQGELVAVVSSGKVRDRSGPVALMTWHIDVQEVRKFVQQTRELMAPKTAEEFTRRGERRLEANRIRDAIEDFSDAIRLDKKYGRAFQKRAWAFCLRSDYDTAIADCDVAIRLNEDDADAYFYRGWALDEKKQYDRAITDYTRAIQLGTRLGSAYNNRGVVYSRKKEKQQALADYLRAVEVDPKNAVAWSNAADLLHDFREYDKAVEHATRSIYLNPFRSIAWRVRGWAFRDAGKLEAALQNFNDAIDFDGKEPTFFVNRGIVFSKMNGQLNRAVQDYTTAIRLKDNYALAYLCRGEAYEKASLISDAHKDYETAIRLDPDYKSRVKRRYTCLFRVANNTGEPIRVYLQYEYESDKGDWVWWPNQNWHTYDFSVGETANLLDGKWKIRARRVRVWAVGQRTGNTYGTYRTNDLSLTPASGILAQDELVYTFKFNR